MLTGRSKSSEFRQSPERITNNSVADGVGRREETGLISRTLYQERPKRYAYALTEKGRGLVPVVQAICRWANRYEEGTWAPPESFMTATVEPEDG